MVATDIRDRRQRERHRSGPARDSVPGGARIVTITLGNDQLAVLDEVATRRGVNRSELIARCIDQALARQQAA